MSTHCDPEFEDSKPIFLHDTLAHDVASPYQVWLQKVQQLRWNCPNKHALEFWTFCVTLILTTTEQSNLFTRLLFCLLVGALSPVNHKGLHQGWTQTSLYLQVIHFTSHYTTSHVFFLAYLYSAGTQHRNLHPAGWPILRAYTGTNVSHSQHRKKSGEVFEKMQVNGLEG